MIGQGLVATGAVVAATADDDQAQLVGLGLILAGLATSATASADTRHNELLPQRVYVAAVDVAEPDSAVRIEAGGRESASMTLLGVDPPSGERFQLRYVRMNAPGALPRWASSKQVYYRSDSYDGALALLDSGGSSGGYGEGSSWDAEPLGDLPYILGGQDVSTPTHEALARYQAAGYLRGFTLSDLMNLYREERITLTTEEQGGAAARHILEGGSSLVAPLAGTAGFARLFQTPHPAYRARSELVRRVAGEQRAVLDPYASP